MNYLIFHKDIFLSQGASVKRFEEGAPALKEALQAVEKAAICVIDCDIELASAPEAPVEKKDSLLARKFSKLHPNHEYVLQDEKVDDNIFQVIGIKAGKVSEIYGLINSERVDVFIPYGMALRHFLLKQNFNLDKGLIFIDDLGDEKLLTVFCGPKFSVTRTLAANEMDGILPEIKRSQIGFSKKIGEFEGRLIDPVVLTNSRTLADSLRIEYINADFPAIEGLKSINGSAPHIKFLLAEEIKEKKRKQEMRVKALSLSFGLLILGMGLSIALINQIQFGLIKGQVFRLQKENKELGDKLASLDVKTYREDLKQQKFLNYASPYFKLLNLLPESFELYAFRFYQTDKWNLDAYVAARDGESFDNVPRLSILRKAAVSDYWIKDKPGKRIQIEL